METYDITDGKGRLYAFEIDNTYFGFARQAVVKIIKGHLPEAKVLRTPKPLSSFREDTFCEFELAGSVFEVLEPFGDNSRYWIGPKDRTWHSEIDTIQKVFAKIRHFEDY